MKWTLPNIILSVLFVLAVNGLFLGMRLTGKRALLALFAALSLLLYTAMFLYGLTQSITMEQTLLLLVATLPSAFIKLHKEDGNEL